MTGFGPRSRAARWWIRRLVPLGMAIVIIGKGALSAALGAGDERAIWEVWKLHEGAPDDHEAVVAACDTYAKTHVRDPYLGVAETLGAWHLLRLGRYGDAVKVLEKYTGRETESLARGINMVGAAWLTRIDREVIKEALQFHYRREVGYPSSLKELAAYEGLPKKLAFREKDRWENRWDYRLTGFKRIPNLLNQKYKLEASKLGDGSDLAEALALQYGAGIRIRPVGVQAGLRHGLEMIEFEVAPVTEADAPGMSPQRPKTDVVGVGTMTEGVFLAHVGEKILVVCDRWHWKLFGKPPGR